MSTLSVPVCAYPRDCALTAADSYQRQYRDIGSTREYPWVPVSTREYPCVPVRTREYP